MRTYKTFLRGATMFVQEVKNVSPDGKDIFTIGESIPRALDPGIILSSHKFPPTIKALQIRSHDNKHFFCIKSSHPISNLNEEIGAIQNELK